MNLYEILGVSQDASFEEIREAYKKMAKIYHPDLNPPELKQKVELIFIEIKRAYDVLYNPDKRFSYDKYLQNINNTNFKNRTVKEERDNKQSEQTKQQYDSQQAIELEKEMIKRNKSNYAYDVTMRGGKINVPNYCCCCMGEADYFTSITYTLKIPICKECIAHISKHNIFEISSTAFSVIFSIIMTSITYYLCSTISLLFLLCFGVLISSVSLYVIDKLYEEQTLSDHHAHRNCAAKKIFSTEGYYIQIRFYNWLYAELFAKANGIIYTAVEGNKITKKSNLLKMKVQNKIVILAIVLPIVFNTTLYSVTNQRNTNTNSIKTQTEEV